MDFLAIIMFIVALLIMAIGLAGIILPILPGTPIIFAGALLYAIVTGFKDISFELILIFAGMTAVSLIFDYVSNYFSVRRMGGGKAGAIGAVLGVIIGIFIHWLAIIILPFLLAVLFEIIAGRRTGRALKAGTGAWIGLLVGGVFRFAIGCVMIGIFIWQVIF
jgi:uncharacterized protein YqgC (DUF456 family)